MLASPGICPGCPKHKAREGPAWSHQARAKQLVRRLYTGVGGV